MSTKTLATLVNTIGTSWIVSGEGGQVYGSLTTDDAAAAQEYATNLLAGRGVPSGQWVRTAPGQYSYRPDSNA